MTATTTRNVWTAEDFADTLTEAHDACEGVIRRGEISRDDADTVNRLFASALTLRDAGRYDDGIENLDRARRLVRNLTN